MVVFSGKNFNHALSEGEVPGILYGMSDSGWMDQDLFSTWFSTHFLQHAVSSRPIVLLLDGHSSHFTLELVKTAAEHDVIIFCQPPHTTADSQPLDISCFGPLKTYWSEACCDFLFSNPGRVITKFQVSKLFARAWSKGMSIENCVAGFKSTGICPFNPQAILKKLPSSTSSTAESENVNSIQPLVNAMSENSGDSETEDSETEDTQLHLDPTPRFSPETNLQYETRFRSGYDIFYRYQLCCLAPRISSRKCSKPFQCVRIH